MSDDANPYGIERPNGAKPYDQDKEGVAMSEGVPATSRANVPNSKPTSANVPNSKPTPGNVPNSKPTPYHLGVIDSKVDTSRGDGSNVRKTLRTRRFEAQQAYGQRRKLNGILGRNGGRQ